MLHFRLHSELLAVIRYFADWDQCQTSNSLAQKDSLLIWMHWYPHQILSWRYHKWSKLSCPYQVALPSISISVGHPVVDLSISYHGISRPVHRERRAKPSGSWARPRGHQIGHRPRVGKPHRFFYVNRCYQQIPFKPLVVTHQWHDNQRGKMRMIKLTSIWVGNIYQIVMQLLTTRHHLLLS